MADTIELIMTNLCDTQALAEEISSLLQAGDTLALEGDLGAGKSAFARALIRAYRSDPQTEVPSPTFTIVQSYEASGKPDIWHADLYRLSDPEELYELGLEEVRDDSVVIVEWPDRLDKVWRDAALTLKFEILPDIDDMEELPRAITICAPPAWADRLSALRAKA